MSNKVHQTGEGLDSLKKGQGVLTSHVDTMNRELTSVKTQHETLSSHLDTMDRELTSVRTKQKDLSDQVDRNLTALRNQELDKSNTPLTTEGMLGVLVESLYTPSIFSWSRSSFSLCMLS